MTKRIRLTRHFKTEMTEDGYRRLRRFAQEAGLSEGEALSFVFEHFNSVTDEETLPHRLTLWKAELEKQRSKT